MKILPLFLPAALVLTVFACSDDDTESVPTPAPGAGSTLDGSTTPPAQDDASPPVDADSGNGDGATTAFALTAPWAEGAAIPTEYVCSREGGSNGSPALSWTGAPAGTQSFAIVMRDESLAQASNYHWVLYDMPAVTTSLPANLPQTATLSTPAGARQTKWSFSSDLGYSGPCPPNAHNYRITLHALDTTLGALANNPETADTAIKAASIASTSVLGTFTP